MVDRTFGGGFTSQDTLRCRRMSARAFACRWTFVHEGDRPRRGDGRYTLRPDGRIPLTAGRRPSRPPDPPRAGCPIAVPTLIFRLYRRAVRDYRPQSAKSWFERALQAFAQTRFGGLLFLSVFPAIDRRLIPVTRGRLSTGLGQPIVLLHTRGAKSGLERTTPLLATKHGDRTVVVASRAGATRHPGCYHNLLADPDVDVTADGRCARGSSRARSAIGCGRWPATTIRATLPIRAARERGASP